MSRETKQFLCITMFALSVGAYYQFPQWQHMFAATGVLGVIGAFFFD